MTNLSMEEAKAILEEHDVSRRDALKAGALAVAGSAAMSGSAGAQSGDEPLIELAEGSTSPTENGQISRNGKHVEVFSGDSLKRLNNALDGSQGADGEVWTSTGSGAQWEAASAGGSDGLVPLRSVTASAQASVDFDQGNITTTHRVYKIYFTSLLPATDAVELQAVVSTDGGSTYQTGASDYAWAASSSEAGGIKTATGSDGATEMDITQNTSNAAGDEISGEIMLYGPADSGQPTQIRANTSRVVAGDDDYALLDMSGRRNADEANDAIRFEFQSGNIATGTFDLYGVTTP